jgi:signal peptidase I
VQPTLRKAWLAALLSLLLSGLGHLYAGRWRRAGVFVVGELVATLTYLLLLTYWTSAPWNVAIGFVVFFGWRVVAAADAYRVAARAAPCVGRPAWIRWPVYAAAFLLGYFVPALALRATVFEAFRVPLASMADTIMPGDRMLATKWNVGSPERGELVVFSTPAGVNFVKRVVGLPGDRIEVRDGVASVNGKPLAEPYVRRQGADPGVYGPVEVPAACYFVLGDNRNRSKDSRVDEIGFVPSDRIVARPRAIFYSADPATGDIRWDRVGRPLR